MSTSLSAIDQKTNTAETRSNILVPKLRFREFDGFWKKSLLDNVAKRGSGHTPSKNFANYYNGGIKWVSLADSKKLDKGYIEDTEFKISQEGIKNSSAVLHPKESVLLSRDAGVGKSAVMKSEMAVSQHFIVWQGKDEILSNWFLYHILQILKPEFERIAVGSTIKTIGLPYFKKLNIVIPDFPEQQKIASFLSSVDEKIQQLTRKKELLEQYKKGVMQNLFSGKLRFKDENGKDFPDWEEKKFKNFVKDYRLGGNYQNTTELTDYPLIKMGNLDRGKIKLDKIEYIPINQVIDSKDEIKYGDLFFNTRNTLDLVGKVAIWRNELPVAYYNSNLMYLKFDNNFFMNYSFNSYEGVKALKRFATGTTSVAAIYTKDLLKLELSIPCLEEQQKIASYLSSIDTKIESVTNQITQTQTYKKGLLQQLFV